MHKAAVRVHEAPINARRVFVGRYLSARRDRASQGDLKLTRIPSPNAGGCAFVCIKRPGGEAHTGAFGSGSDDRLRARGKRTTLHGSCFEPVRPDK